MIHSILDYLLIDWLPLIFSNQHNHHLAHHIHHNEIIAALFDINKGMDASCEGSGYEHDIQSSLCHLVKEFEADHRKEFTQQRRDYMEK